MLKLFRGPLIVLAVIILLPLAGYFLVQYEWSGPVRLGVRVDTIGVSVQHVTVDLRPGVQLDYDLVTAPGSTYRRDTHGFLPRSLHLSFDDTGGNNHEFTVNGVPANFEGKVTIVITKDTDYHTRLELDAAPGFQVGPLARPAPSSN